MPKIHPRLPNLSILPLNKPFSSLQLAAMTDKNTFYVTTPIYYVNDRPHIGHVYTTTIADVLARYNRLNGKDTFFLTGTDEHATKVVDAAADRGLTTQQWADQNATAFQETFAKLGMTHNDFIRTSQTRHMEKVSAYVKTLLDSGDVYLGEYSGWYDAGQEEYVTESNAHEADYKSPINGKPLVKKTEKNYFFKLSKYQDQLLTLLDKNEAVNGQTFKVLPAARKNEIIARIKDGLHDIPMSRSGMTDWGINVPGDDTQTIYVWIDALFNYLSTVDIEGREKYWAADLHLIAKDILWFHAAIWPALLLALDKPLPKCLYSHSFWISEGKKMSKSLGNFIDLEKIDHYVETFSLDALRYFLIANGPMGTTDSDFSEAKFIETYNTVLANTFGNCFSRVSNMTAKYFDGKIPATTTDNELPEEMKKLLLDGPENAAALYQKHMKNIQPGKAANTAMSIISSIDSYIEQTAPFKLAKQEENLPQVANILYNCAEALRVASVLLWPIIPNGVQTLWERIDANTYSQALKDNGTGDFAAWTKWGQLQTGTVIIKGDPLYMRHQVKK